MLRLEDNPALSSEIKSFLRGKYRFDRTLFFKQIYNHTYDVYLLNVNVPEINDLGFTKSCDRLVKLHQY
jgi:hypothetical protein